MESSRPEALACSGDIRIGRPIWLSPFESCTIQTRTGTCATGVTFMADNHSATNKKLGSCPHCNGAYELDTRDAKPDEPEQNVCCPQCKLFMFRAPEHERYSPPRLIAQESNDSRVPSD